MWSEKIISQVKMYEIQHSDSGIVRAINENNN